MKLKQIAADHPNSVTQAAISRAFGTPKPTLTGSYLPELLNLRTFPTLMGYSSRIMAESWESNLLYYAALADELHMPPSQLNVAVPQWTQLTVEKIFATHLEDWPALLRSLRLVGEDVRSKARKQLALEQKAALQNRERRMRVRRLEARFLESAGFAAALFLYAQERPTFRVKVDMVVLGFTVTDARVDT